ncbi:MAG TPA: hypothetical protein VFY21_05725 [Xanthobacteraceae bacterium]|nr:hypothetical protein [Xanthobacteraceae bacterium]
MRAFSIAVLLAVLLGAGFWAGLKPFHNTSAEAFSTSGVRLNIEQKGAGFGPEVS